MLKKLIIVSICIILSSITLAGVSHVQADDTLKLDRDYQSTVDIFNNNMGILQFKYPSQMQLIETNSTVELSTTEDVHTALVNQETFIGSMTITSLMHVNAIPEMISNADDLSTDFAVLAENIPNLLDETHLILSQAEFMIGEHNVIEFVVLTDVKYSIFLVEYTTPLVVVARSYDYYSDVLRNTAVDMIGTFAVDMEAEIRPRNLVPVLAESERLAQDSIGTRQMLNMTDNQRGYYVDIAAEEGDLYFLSLTSREGYSRPILWILDSEGNVLQNALGEYPFDGYSRALQGVFTVPDSNNFTLFISLVGNEDMDSLPLSGEFQFAYQVVRSIPYAGEIESSSILTFGSNSMDNLEYLNFTFPTDSLGSHLFDIRIYPYDATDVLYIVPLNTVGYGISYSRVETDSLITRQHFIDEDELEGEFIIIVRDNWQNTVGNNVESTTISLNFE